MIDGTFSTIISCSWLLSPPLFARIANFFLLSAIVGGFRVKLPEPIPPVPVYARVAPAPPASDSRNEVVLFASFSQGVVVTVGTEYPLRR